MKALLAAWLRLKAIEHKKIWLAICILAVTQILMQLHAMHFEMLVRNTFGLVGHMLMQLLAARPQM